MCEKNVYLYTDICEENTMLTPVISGYVIIHDFFL